MSDGGVRSASTKTGKKNKANLAKQGVCVCVETGMSVSAAGLLRRPRKGCVGRRRLSRPRGFCVSRRGAVSDGGVRSASTKTGKKTKLT